MKKSQIAALIVFLLLIPLTLFLGLKLPGRSYYITATVIVLEMMVPFFMAFEGRKVQARELTLLAVMCALAIAGRVAIPLHHVKAAFAMIIITGVAFGPEPGFMVGAITAFVSNFAYGHGPFTPWQMFAYGAAGLLAGFCFHKGAGKPWVLAVFGFAVVMLCVGPIMDLSGITFLLATISWKSILTVLTTGILVNLVQAVTTAVVLLILGRPLLDKLDRIRLKYGMLENESDR